MSGRQRRLDQILSSLGYCSRREARDWLDAGRVAVNGSPARDTSLRCAANEVRVDGEALDHPDGLLILLNKPAGLVCSHEAGEGPRVYDLLPDRWLRRNPALTTVGRLDRDTTGLLLLTDRTDLVHRLTSPRSKVPKTYRARLGAGVKADRQDQIARTFASGSLRLEGEIDACLPAELHWESEDTALLTLTEGRFHQVRRMFATVGCSVIALDRRSFGAVELSELSLGSWVLLPMDIRI